MLCYRSLMTIVLTYRMPMQIHHILIVLFFNNTLGIPINLIPSTESGTVKLQNFNQWIKTIQILENNAIAISNNATGHDDDYRRHTYQKGKGKGKQGTMMTVTNVIVECPHSSDVIFRRGQMFKEHPGNDIFRDSILNYLTEKDDVLQQKLQEAKQQEQQHLVDADAISLSLSHTSDGSSGFFNDDDNAMVAISFGADGKVTPTIDSTIPPPPIAAQPTKKKKRKKKKSDVSKALKKDSDKANKDRDDMFCNWLMNEILQRRGGRFLEWDHDLNSWIQIFDPTKIKSKISVSLYNYEKRYSSSLRRQAHERLEQEMKAMNQPTSAATAIVNSKSRMISTAPTNYNSDDSGVVTVSPTDVTASKVVPSGIGGDGGSCGNEPIETNPMSYSFINGSEPESTHRGHNKRSNTNCFRFDQHCGECLTTTAASDVGTTSSTHHDDDGIGRKKARTHSFDD